MKLAYWMYSGPAHIGTLRIATSFQNVHAIMHAPLGDDYFNVMRSMLERERNFTAVTTSVVDRHVLAQGSQEKVINQITRKDKEENPDLIILTPTCTSSILQEDLQNFVDRASLESNADVILADVNHYRVNEFQAADRTLEQIVRFYLEKKKRSNLIENKKTENPSVNIIGFFTLGFHHQHDCRELKKLLKDLNIDINLIIPEGTNVKELPNLTKAWFNIVPYREVGYMTALYLEKEWNMPFINITPIGLIETTRFIEKIQSILVKLNYDINVKNYIKNQISCLEQVLWFSKLHTRDSSILNSTEQTAVIFGDTTHSLLMSKIFVREMGIKVLWSGSFCKYDSSWFVEQIQNFVETLLITEEHAKVANAIAKSEPKAVFGTQMERHTGKRLGLPCGVISAPIHIQNYPLGFRPFMGYEGLKQITDLVYNSFLLGPNSSNLFESFGNNLLYLDSTNQILNDTVIELVNWSESAKEELLKYPGFAREKIKSFIEKFATKQKIDLITLDLFYIAIEKI
uniref:Light-independent protochlorophyllide reductase subunit B n=1 Tax=Gloeochaete wittrockiana TaxID=38269 RepID=A0A3G1IW28_9EUKA|nr:photochlorophyllide reductase subunit B [Gloeochaete wittrockiana]ASQ40266.1 photochlorophyllide reductase subunit B [Gloeochaete wittrockiana]